MSKAKQILKYYSVKEVLKRNKCMYIENNKSMLEVDKKLASAIEEAIKRLSTDTNGTPEENEKRIIALKKALRVYKQKVTFSYNRYIKKGFSDRTKRIELQNKSLQEFFDYVLNYPIKITTIKNRLYINIFDNKNTDVWIGTYESKPLSRVRILF